MKLPDRWLNYSNSGRIQNTRFIACKVPLKEGFNRNLPAGTSFTPADLIRKHPNIRLVIDLTCTSKYYNGTKEFKNNGVDHVKIMCRGHFIPSEENFKTFTNIVDDFLLNSPPNYLIAVHCTHGVNRTGYVIVRYMIERLGFSGKDALRTFVRSRGHGIERTNYIDDLLRRRPVQVEQKRQGLHHDMPFTLGLLGSALYPSRSSAINVNDPTLRKIAQEINLAEMLLLQYLKEVSMNQGDSLPSQKAAVDHLSHLVVKELEYLRKVKNSEVVNVTGSFATFKSDDGEFLVTVVPEEELQQTCHPLFCFKNIKPRFAKPVNSRENFAVPSPSAESVYYDACYDLPVAHSSNLPAEPPALGKSIFGLLSYIFASTIGKMDAPDGQTLFK